MNVDGDQQQKTNGKRCQLNELDLPKAVVIKLSPSGPNTKNIILLCSKAISSSWAFLFTFKTVYRANRDFMKQMVTS